jgi:hypothetical protein
MTLQNVLELAALGAAALGVPVAVYQLYVGRREAQAGRDLEVALSLSESFREKWDSQWGASMMRIRSGLELSDSETLSLESMLNWIDWLGTLIRHGHLADSGTVLDTLAYPINDLLRHMSGRILADVEREGRDYWGGVLEVASITFPGFESGDSGDA